MRLCANDVGRFEFVRRGVGCVFNGGKAGDFVFAVSCGDSPGGEAVIVAMSQRGLRGYWTAFAPCSSPMPREILCLCGVAKNVPRNNSSEDVLLFFFAPQEWFRSAQAVCY